MTKSKNIIWTTKVTFEPRDFTFDNPRWLSQWKFRSACVRSISGRKIVDQNASSTWLGKPRKSRTPKLRTKNLENFRSISRTGHTMSSIRTTMVCCAQIHRSMQHNGWYSTILDKVCLIMLWKGSTARYSLTARQVRIFRVFLVYTFFYRQLDFSSEPGVTNEISENEPKVL